MVKLALNAAPTFMAPVKIPVAGADPVEAIFTFKHRTRTQLDEFMKSRAGKSDTETFMEMVEGWNIDLPFTKENIDTLIENYLGTPLATYRAYIEELVQAKAKN